MARPGETKTESLGSLDESQRAARLASTPRTDSSLQARLESKPSFVCSATGFHSNPPKNSSFDVPDQK
ncbi:hypothetical protein L195_g053260 [Trifolium pratense]|uniref:Uncharacterized protein n=1 Tax=Trifolium pratense TaxID=57577 RepID=A0A2K3K9I2_TRIPR|nr:hypothetical protein L195_g053260 [Trifolium pratense]